MEKSKSTPTKESLSRWPEKLAKAEQKKFEEAILPKPESNDVKDLAKLYSPMQQQFLKDLKVNLEDQFGKFDPSWDDWFLLRFCRARKWSMIETMKMFIEYYEIVNERWIYTILERMDMYKEDYAIKEAHSQSPHFSIDRQGRPLKIERWGAFHGVELLKMNQRNKIDMVCYEEESLIHAVYPICSHLKGKRIDNDLWIHDFTGFEMKV